MIASKCQFLNWEILLCEEGNLFGLSAASIALNLTSTTKLAVSCSAQHEHIARACSNKAGVTAATNNFLNFLIEVYFSGLTQIVTVWMAELAINAQPPGINLSLISEKGRVILTHCNIHNLGNSMRKIDGVRFVQIVALNTQLSISVCTPWIKFARFIHAQGVIISTFNLHDIS